MIQTLICCNRNYPPIIKNPPNMNLNVRMEDNRLCVHKFCKAEHIQSGNGMHNDYLMIFERKMNGAVNYGVKNEFECTKV